MVFLVRVVGCEFDFCCCRSCKCVFASGADYLGHLSVNGFCRGGVDLVVRELAWIVLHSR